ncbi:MAG: type II toxin-antitoxin system HicA family toxin [Candidatus Staskawiczbacteria bacterium]|nr:type II toxin-antitoxin system HicA family toxin [Candidatus Staskawiczbacteria bacterium]
MPKLPRIPSVLAIKALKRAGYFEYHCSGSHIQLRHVSDKTKRVTIPFHRKDLSPKTLKSIIDQAGLTVEEFIKLLK